MVEALGGQGHDNLSAMLKQTLLRLWTWYFCLQEISFNERKQSVEYGQGSNGSHAMKCAYLVFGNTYINPNLKSF